MYSPENKKFDREFNRMIKHDFKKYVLLKPNGLLHLNEGVILEAIYKMEGYKRHKKVIYGEQHTSHIIVMFIDVYAALEATARFNLMTCGLTAILVDDMLRCWFTFERKTCLGPPHSFTIVDIIGKPPFNVNFLTSNILSDILQDFGTPYLLPYTAALKEPHMQVLFSSMTEALAACMAFGEWYCMEEKADCFFYRIRINPSNKEQNLIKNCGGVPSEAFHLSYFITFKREAKIERVKDSVPKEEGTKPKASATEGIGKTHKKNCPFVQNSKFRHTTPLGFCTPVLYFPIVPTNRFNAHASTNNQLGAGFTTALLNLQQTVAAQPVVAIANPENGNNIAPQYQSLQEIPECTDDKKSESQSNASQNNSNKKFQRYGNGPTRTRDNYRRPKRVFERRNSSGK